MCFIYSLGKEMRLPNDLGRVPREFLERVKELSTVMSPKISGRDCRLLLFRYLIKGEQI